MRKGVARLRATEGFLVTCLSGKAIGIRQREAEALRQKLEKVGPGWARRRGPRRSTGGRARGAQGDKGPRANGTAET